MYEKFFGLSDLPFSIAPNPRYLYMSHHHHEALAHLLYGVQQDGGFILLTGEVGTGKTTVCRCFLEKLPENCHVAFILNSKLTIEELLETLCDELGIAYVQDSISVKGYLDVLNHFLLKAHAQHKKVLLIIDEAQNLSIDVLEQIRLLTNLETDQRKLLQIVLIGQPELRSLFEKQELRQLAQRITARYHLKHLSLQETDAYIRHRLEVAGCSYELFPKPVVRMLYKLTDGIPRLINVLADRALLGAYVSGQRYVDRTIMKQAAQEVRGHKRLFSSAFWQNHFLRLKIKIALAGVFFVIAVLAVITQAVRQSEIPKPQISAGGASKDNPTLTLPLLGKGMEIDLKNEAEATEGQAKEAQANSGNSTLPAAGEAAIVENASTHPLKDPVAELERQLTVIEQAAPTAPPTLDNLWQPNWPSVADFSSALHYLYVKAGQLPSQADLQISRCRQAYSSAWQCLQQDGASFTDLQNLPVPLILTLRQPEEVDDFYAVLTRITPSELTLAMNPALLKSRGITQIVITPEELARYWKGQYTLLWRAPPGYYGAIVPGTIGPEVKWLSQQMGLLYNDPALAAGISIFNEALLQRVKTFQSSVGLPADGVVGAKTLIQLNKVLQQRSENPSASVSSSPISTLPAAQG